MVLASEEVDASIRAEFDPPGINIVSLSNWDLGCNLPIIVLVTNGSEGKLKLPVSML
jgi:hypothetical protein